MLIFIQFHLFSEDSTENSNFAIKTKKKRKKLKVVAKILKRIIGQKVADKEFSSQSERKKEVKNVEQINYSSEYRQYENNQTDRKKFGKLQKILVFFQSMNSSLTFEE